MPGVMTADQVAFEDLSPAHEALDQRDVPFYSRLKTGKRPEALLYGVGFGKMGKRRKGGVPERQDVKGFEGDNGKKLYGRLERFQRNPSVSTEAEEFKNNQAVTDLDYDEQVTKKIKENKRDIDYWMLSDQESQEDDGITGYHMRGLGRTINDGSTGASTAQGGASAASYSGGVADLVFRDQQTAIPSAYRTPTAQIFAGALAEFTEQASTAMLQTRWLHAGTMQDFTLWCGALLKGQISDNFGRYVPNKPGYDTIVTTSRADIDKRKLVIAGVDVIESDYGTFTVELEPWMPTGSRGYGTDMTQLAKKVLYLARHMEFENKGGGRRGLIDSIVGLWAGDPRAHFKICPNDEVTAQVDFEA